MRHTRGIRPAAWIALSLVALIATAGCPSTPKPAEQPAVEQFPSIAEIRSRVGRRAEERVKGPIVAVEFDAVTFPLNLDTAPMWKPEMQAPIPAVQLRRWQANGLQIGVVKRRQARNVVAAIPKIYAVQNEGVLPRKGSPMPLRFLPPQRVTTFTRYFATPPADLVAELLIPPADLDPEMNDTVLELPAGTYGFLVEAEQMLLDKVLVKITPQCHWLEPSLRPRSPFDTVKDGRIFDELTISLLLDAADILVVGYNPMPPLPEPKTPEQPHDSIHDFPLENLKDIEGVETAPPPAESPVQSAPSDATSTANSSSLPTDETRVMVDDAPQRAGDADAGEPAQRKRKFVPMPRLGEMLLTFDYQKEPAQILIFITPEVLGQVLETPMNAAPGPDPNVIDPATSDE
jgi:hypothetical protein